MKKEKIIEEAMNYLSKVKVIKPILEREGEDFFTSYWFGVSKHDNYIYKALKKAIQKSKEEMLGEIIDLKKQLKKCRDIHELALKDLK